MRNTHSATVCTKRWQPDWKAATAVNLANGSVHSAALLKFCRNVLWPFADRNLCDKKFKESGKKVAKTPHNV